MTINEAVQYIDENLMEDLRLVDIAEMMGYSPWYLYELFKKHTKKPIMTYIREARIKRAASEMASGRRLFDIAVDYGFDTQAGFYKAFDKVIGCSPSDYARHELRGNRHENTELINNIRIGDAFMENVIIREVRQSDTKDLWENIFSRNTPSEVEEHVAGNIEKMKTGDYIHYVAEVDGVVVGNMSFNRDTHPLGRHKCFLGDVVVNPAFQRMGLAQNCLKNAKIRQNNEAVNLLRLMYAAGLLLKKFIRNSVSLRQGEFPAVLLKRGAICAFTMMFFSIRHYNIVISEKAFVMADAFNMLVLVGAVKMADRIVREMMGL